jgi:restriction system protein
MRNMRARNRRRHILDDNPVRLEFVMADEDKEPALPPRNSNTMLSGLPWDNNSWDVAAEIAARRPSAAVAAALGMTTGTTDTPLTLRASSPPPQLQIMTIIVPGQKTTDGQLVEAVALPWFDIVEILKKDPTAAFQIDPRKWEEIIAGAYKKAGFDEVTLTPRSGDLGRDVIAIKKGLGSVRVIDQVKAFAPTHLVPADDVRALMGVVIGDRASKGFLTTTSNFAPGIATDRVIQDFIPNRLELINGSMLLTRLDQLARNR